MVARELVYQLLGVPLKQLALFEISHMGSWVGKNLSCPLESLLILALLDVEVLFLIVLFQELSE